MSSAPEKSWVIASDVSKRDGIGVELWLGDEIIMEVFRDDSKLVREVTLFRQDVPLELVEEAIAKFKVEIPWDFLP